MYIKEIILDGFKSYATRTVISGFDKRFNAITGLNGSGKSNILDAICFVLGITQLSQVRVSNLQGLVYKQGQAGVTKASVTIVFDNNETKQSPVGYEKFKEITITRQVVIGGKNKYLINGHNAQASQVQNLFHSVQLNVNNPHFLIMQGRITKVLNMKPKEILGMIEEAAGTRMYESKKQSAEKKMEQKQVKVDEIEKLLCEEITPKLEKLRSEKQSYLKWAANNTELERIQRFLIAHEFNEKKGFLSRSGEKLAEMKSKLDFARGEMTSLKEQKRTMEKMQEKIRLRRDQEVSEDLRKLIEEEESTSKTLIRSTSQLENAKDASMRKQKSLTNKKTRLDEVVALLNKQNDQYTQISQQASKKKEDMHLAEETVQRALSGLQAANAGLDEGIGKDEEKGKARTLTEKLTQITCAIQLAESSMKQISMKLNHERQESKSIESQLSDADGADAFQDLDCQRSYVTEIKSKLNELEFNQEELDSLLQQRLTLETDLSEAKEKYIDLSNQLSSIDATWNMDKHLKQQGRVKGIVAKLIKVKDRFASTALEVVAGGKLYQVVVDTAETGKQLINSGNLKKRVTIIPLDKVSNRKIPEHKVKTAAKLAETCNGSARPALSLIGYDKEISSAMEYVFGTTLVCDTVAAARKVTFSKDVSIRSVTLEGDLFDPQGTLSGGSRSSSGGVLLRLEELAKYHQLVDNLEANLKSTLSKLEKAKQSKSMYKTLNKTLETELGKVSLLEAQVLETPYGQLFSRKAKIEKSIKELSDKFHDEREKKSANEDLARELEEEMKDMAFARNKLVKRADAKLKESKKNLVILKEAYEKANEAKELAQLEINQLTTEQQALLTDISELEIEISGASQKVHDLDHQIKDLEDKHKTMKTELEKRKSTLSGIEEDLSKMAKNISDIEKRIFAYEVEAKKLEGKLNRFDKEEKTAQSDIKRLLEKHPWISSEERFFGKPHTDYDFASVDLESAKEKLQNLKGIQAALGQKINKKVIGMIEKAETEYHELVRKRSIIEKDRQTIERVIEGLDKKKNEALETTYDKVNKDFGSIFSSLLHDAGAKLDHVEGGSLFDGLEIKVAFGNNWKDSLTELSGGQRSLIALSLILALLLFKPAPMYILDEVDAALDLSHTQNIGHMLRTHFAHSQFIVVSLKEGMFNNANVIFRTKFVDGVSTVTRTTAIDKSKENLLKVKSGEKRKRVKGSAVPLN